MNESPDELRLTAKAIYGLEEVLSFELKKLGARDIELHNRAVSFTGDKGLIYKCNLHLRTALRILVPVEKFNVQDEQSLYDGIKAIDWEKYMGVDDTLAHLRSLFRDNIGLTPEILALMTAAVIYAGTRSGALNRPYHEVAALLNCAREDLCNAAVTYGKTLVE